MKQNRFVSSNKNPMLHVINECPRLYYISYIVRRGSPLLQSIDTIVRYAFEAGIVRMWYQHVEYAITTNRQFHHMNVTEETKPFNIKDMQFPFYVLFMGLFFSTLVFISEVMVDKRKQTKPFPFVHWSETNQFLLSFYFKPIKIYEVLFHLSHWNLIILTAFHLKNK